MDRILLRYRFGAGLAGLWPFSRVVILLFTLSGSAALAGRPAAGPDTGGAALCEMAALRVAAETGVPADILGALTLTETGRRIGGSVRPWAWSVNAEGKGAWFDAPAEALAFAEDRIALGRRNVDIGCFQINYRWHGQHFASVAAMFDPVVNARYAASFLRRLYEETGDWRAAAGAFHSRRPDHAGRYLERFDDLRVAFRARGFQHLASAPETYNSFSGAAPMPEAKVRAARRKLTLLGAPIGSAVTGQAGSLAVIGGADSALFSDTNDALIDPSAGPLFLAENGLQGRAPDYWWR